MNFEELYRIACNNICVKKYNMYLKTGDCVCVLETKTGKIYLGYSQKFSNATICAEKAAIIEALNHGETKISKIITICKSGDVIPPCGECLNLISHLEDSFNIEIMVSLFKIVRFKELFPYDWKCIDTYNIDAPRKKEDIYNLNRFVIAQENTYDIALKEIKEGKIQGHWICFVWPNHKKMAQNIKSEYYGISSIEEAIAYYNHEVLGRRLIQITETINNISKPVSRVLGESNANKLKASMTLFYIATKKQIFKDVIDKLYHGDFDFSTLEVLEIDQ